MADLTGKTALVTGGNKGIGREIASALSARGATVVVNYPHESARPEGLDALPGAVAIRADIGKVAEIEAMFAEVAARHGGVDILVNNAGIFPRATVLDLTEAVWDAVHDVNLKGAFFTAQAAAHQMVDRGVRGRIVNIASNAALQPEALGAHYAATKAGIVALTKSLALGLAPHGIRVNAVAPGLTDTDQPRAGLSEAEIGAWGARVPLGRIARPDDVARAVVYLASDWSEYVTGQTLFVTGGQLMVP